MQKKKSGVKKCLEILPLRGGEVGPLMANAILNFHFDFLTPSLSVIPSLHVKAELELKISGKLNLPMHSANVDVNVKNCGRRQIKPQLKTRCLRSL